MTSNQEQHPQRQKSRRQSKSHGTGTHSPNLPSKPDVTKTTAKSTGWASIASSKAPSPLKTQSQSPPNSTALKKAVKSTEEIKSKNETHQRALKENNHNTNKNKHRKQHSPSASSLITSGTSIPSKTGTTSTTTIISSTASGSTTSESSNNSINPIKSINQNRSLNRTAPISQKNEIKSNFNNLQVIKFLQERNSSLLKKSQRFKIEGSDWINSTKNKKHDKNGESHKLDMVGLVLNKYLNSLK